MSNNKNDIISKIYYDPSGYGSIQNSWKDAHEKDPSIKQSDVKEWFENNVKTKSNVKGQNYSLQHMLTMNFKLTCSSSRT